MILPTWQRKCEWLALCALTTCFFVTMLSVSLTTLFYLAAFLLLLISGNWQARFRIIKHNPAALSFWVLFMLFIIGLFYSTSPHNLMIRDLSSHYWLFTTPFFIALIQTAQWRRMMLNAFLGVMVITVFFSFLKSLTPINPTLWLHKWLHLRHMPEKSSFIWDHITQSYAMNIAAFVCAYRFFFESKFKLGYAILFILMAIDIVFISEGRTGYGIFFVLLVYIGFVRFGWRGVLSAITLTILTISIAFFVSNTFNTRIKNIYINAHQTQRDTSVSERIEMLHIAKIMIEKRPWFGYGTGGIHTAAQTVVPAKDRIFDPSVTTVESIYLNFWLWFGLFGLCVFLCVAVTQIKVSFRLPAQERYLAQVMLIATLFGGLFSSFFNSFPISHLYALLSALCFSALTPGSHHDTTQK